MTEAVKTIWKDSGSSATNPVPDWWEEQRLISVNGILIHTWIDTSSGCREQRKAVETAEELIRLSGQMGASEEELAAALELLQP